MGQTIKINKNKPSEHIKSNVKWLNMGLLPVELPPPLLHSACQRTFNHRPVCLGGWRAVEKKPTRHHNNSVTTTAAGTTKGKQTDPFRKWQSSWVGQSYGTEAGQHMKNNSFFCHLLPQSMSSWVVLHMRVCVSIFICVCVCVCLSLI